MNYKRKSSKAIKLCLTLNLKILEEKRIKEINIFISSNPSRASRADNIEKEIESQSFKKTLSRIGAINRVLKNLN